MDKINTTWLAPDDDVLVSVQSRARRFETVSNSYGGNHCKYNLQGYAWLFTFVTYSLIGMFKHFLICSPKSLEKNLLTLFLSLLVLLKYIN